MRWPRRITRFDRRKVLLEEPIKSLGEFKVPVRLHKEVTVVVVKEE
jgi:ribosomal protein L9